MMELSLLNPIVISKDDKSAIVEITLAPSIPFFHGHFPKHPVLPAVAYLEIATELVKKYFNKPTAKLLEVNKSKFITPLTPDQTIRIKIMQNDEHQYSLTWEAQGKEVCILNCCLAI